MHAFACQLQRRLRGHHEAHARRLVEHGLREPRHAVDHLLGVVQRHQHAQRCESAAQALERVAAADVHAEGCANGGRQRLGVGDGGQLDPAHAVAVGRLAARGEVQRDGGLAHAAGADDADQPVLVDQLVQCRQVFGAANQIRKTGGQVGLQLGG